MTEESSVPTMIYETLNYLEAPLLSYPNIYLAVTAPGYQSGN